MSIPSMPGMVGFAVVLDMLGGMPGIPTEVVFMAARAVEIAVIVISLTVAIDEAIWRC